MQRTLIEFGDADSDRPVPYLIPHAGAGVSALRGLARELGEHLNSVAVRLPGREALLEEPPHTDITTVTCYLARLLDEHAGDRKAILFGHSSGAVTAFETARLLPTGRVSALVVSAQQAPGNLPVHDPPVWALPAAEFFPRVAADGYLPEELVSDPDFLELVEPALRADYRVIEGYARRSEPTKPIPIPIIAVHAENDGAVAAADVAAWANVTTEDFDLITLPGDHNLLRDQAPGLAAVLRRTALGNDPAEVAP